MLPQVRRRSGLSRLQAAAAREHAVVASARRLGDARGRRSWSVSAYGSTADAGYAVAAPRELAVCYAMLCYAACDVLCCAVLCCAVLCRAVLCCAVLCCVVLCYATLCYAMLCNAMLCDAMRCDVMRAMRC